MKTLIAVVSWSHDGADYLVTAEVSGGRKQTRASPREEPEMEITHIEVDGEPGIITDELYVAAQEDGNLYDRVMENLSEKAESARDEAGNNAYRASIGD